MVLNESYNYTFDSSLLRFMPLSQEMRQMLELLMLSVEGNLSTNNKRR